MDHASDAVAPPDADVVQVGDIIWQRAQRRGLVQGAVWTVRVAEVLVLAQDGHQVALVPGQGPVQQLTAAAAALGGWLFASGLSSAQLNTIDSQLTVQLAQAGRYLTPGGNGTGAGSSPAAGLPPGDYVIQVIDAASHVRGASPDAGAVPLVTGGKLSQARHGRISVTQTVDDESTRIAAAPLDGHPGWVAAAAVSLETYQSTQSQVARELAIGGAVFVAAAGLGAYWLARAALSPVERLRQQVAAVSTLGTAAAVEVPSTRDEVAALAGTMSDLLGRLQRALARLRAFVADASHELRTPLAVLQGELELAARPGRDRQELAAAISNASAEARRLARLADHLLLLAKSDQDRLSLQLKRADVRSLLVRSSQFAGSRAADGVTCRVDVPPGLAAVYADRIRQAVDNLVANALRFAPAGSVVELAAWADGTDLTIEVRDRGPGFPAGFLPHAFGRFRRPDDGPVTW